MVCIFVSSVLYGQSDSRYSRQLSITEEEDYFNFRGRGTDEGYTSGTYFNFLFVKEKERFFLGKWLPKAGTNAINTYNIGLTHLIFTPRNMDVSEPVPGDYPYAGALMVNYGLHSANPTKRYSLQTNITGGVIGPLSLAKEIQKFVHRVIGDQEPQGWSNQHPNDILLNIEFAAEKQLTQAGNGVEIIGGANAFAGSMINGAGLYGIIRAGKMNPYFNGQIGRSGTPRHSGTRNSRWQVYVLAKPSFKIIGYNALLEGGLILNRRKNVAVDIEELNISFDYGLVISYGNFGLYLYQKIYSPAIPGLLSHEVGGINLNFSW